MDFPQQKSTDFREWVSFMEGEQTLNSWGYTRNFQGQCCIRNKVEDYSFAVTENNSVLAICPLVLTEKDGVRSFTNDGSYLRGPIISSQVEERRRNGILDDILAHVDELALASSASYVGFFFDPQPTYRFHANPLQEHGYIDTTLNTQILDLGLSEKEMRASLRKSYKALINKGLKTYELRVISCANADPLIHEIYRQTHIKAAGRETRPKWTFDLQFEELKAGEATMICMTYEGRFVQLDYFSHRNGYVYYSSAADDPEFSESCEVPLGHAILWFAQDYFRSQGMKYLEIGWQLYGTQLFSSPSRKEMNISYFKRGFGGFAASLYRGLKFYDPAIRERIVRDAVAQYLEALPQG